MEPIDILQELGTNYKNNLYRFYEYSDSLYVTEDFETWNRHLFERSAAIRELFADNERIVTEVRDILARPLDEETADLLFEAVKLLRDAELHDPSFMIEIYEALIPFYEERRDAVRLIHLYNNCALEEMEFFLRMDPKDPRRTLEKYQKVLALRARYAELPLRARQGIFIAWYNLIGPLPDLVDEYRRQIVPCYREAMDFWRSEAVQRLDGENETILGEIDYLNDVFATGFLQFLQPEVPDREEYFTLLRELLPTMEDTDQAELIQTVLDYQAGALDGHQMLDWLMGRFAALMEAPVPFDRGEDALDFCGNLLDIAVTTLELLSLTETTWEERRRYASAVLSALSGYFASVPARDLPSYFDDLTATIFQQVLPFTRGLEEKEALLLRLVLRRQPITYIHCLMVEQLAVAVAEAVLAEAPALLAPLRSEGLSTDEALLDYLGRAARLHDLGKCLTVGVINLQSRRLTDQEFGYIKLHPAKSRVLLRDDPDFAPYYDVMVGHHKFYNGKGGYPAGFDNTASPYRAAIDLITICDCVDAATDRLGRNYAAGKDFYKVLEELKAGAGERYSPELVDFIARRPELQSKLHDLTGEGRSRVYYRVFQAIAGETMWEGLPG